MYAIVWRSILFRLNYSLFFAPAANDVPTQQPLLYIQPSSAGQQGLINFPGGFIPNTGNPQQQIVNTNSQAAAMSAAAQGYTVMFNPQLAMMSQTQQIHPQQQHQPQTTPQQQQQQQHISLPYVLSNPNVQQQQLQQQHQQGPKLPNIAAGLQQSADSQALIQNVTNQNTTGTEATCK